MTGRVLLHALGFKLDYVAHMSVDDTFSSTRVRAAGGQVVCL